MLISTRLDHLGDMLRPEEKNIITKGVSSIRSPVCNLEQLDATITHERFMSAVVQEFRKEYQIDTKCCMVGDLGGPRDIEYIRKGMSELSTWDWRFGSTPEFTHTLRHNFPWGDVTVEVRSKHGLILDCSFQLTNTHITSTTFELLSQWTRSFYQGKRYGFLRETGQGSDPPGGLHDPLRCERNELILDVKVWLEEAVNCYFDGSS
jgi:lipoate-protein ligase A